VHVFKVLTLTMTMLWTLILVTIANKVNTLCRVKMCKIFRQLQHADNINVLPHVTYGILRPLPQHLAK
jgi:hypothetical protein